MLKSHKEILWRKRIQLFCWCAIGHIVVGTLILKFL